MQEATARKGRKSPNVMQKRNNKNTKELRGWHLNDKVIYHNRYGWISGFTGTSAYVKDINDEYMQIQNKNYKPITLNRLKIICHNNNWQYFIKRGDILALPILSMR